MDKRQNNGILWSKLPAMTVVTPKGNYFPVPMDINLGDSKIVDKYIEEHLRNFTKGILPMPTLDKD